MAIQNRRRSNASRKYYVDGNTVRKSRENVALPREQEIERHRKQRQEDYRKRKQSALRQRRKAQMDRERALRNRQRFLSVSPLYMAFFSLCVCGVFAICGIYISLQTQITAHISTISSLQEELLDVRSDNDEKLQRIETSVDLEAIKKKAIKDLGMVYPSSTQIVTYSVEDSDSMVMYSDIEKEEENDNILTAITGSIDP